MTESRIVGDQNRMLPYQMADGCGVEPVTRYSVHSSN